MSSPISLLRDDFENNTIDPLWSAVVSGSATVAETSGQARLTLPSSTAGSHLAYYLSTAAYDLTGDSCYWTIGTMVATGVAANALLDLRSADSQNALRWTQTSGTLKAQTVLAGVATDRYSVAWNASTYKYLRVRESSGTIFFDSSSNGTSWTNRASVANPFAVTSLYVIFAAGCGNVASPGSLRLDDVNVILPAPSSTWRETTADWSISNRLRPVTLAATSNAQGVLVTADTMDASRLLGGTVRYFAGPLGSSSGGFLQLTEYASLVLAEASAFPIPVNGRVDLPAFVDARYMRLYHRSTDASSHTIREFVPRRIVQADDIEAESIQAINISAGAITADKISVASLSAITASMGSLHMDGPIDITSGSLVGGGTAVTLDATGLGMTGPAFSYGLFNASPVTIPRANMLQWSKSSGSQEASIVGSSSAQLLLLADKITLAIPLSSSDNYGLNLQANGAHSMTADNFQVSFGGSTGPVALTVQTNASTGGSVRAHGGLNVGSATGAGSGEIQATVSDSATTARAYPLILNHASSGTPAALFGTGIQFLAEDSTTADQPLMYLDARWKVATHASRASELAFLAFDATTFRVPLIIGSTGSASAVGFHGTTPIAKPTVSGSRGGNVALASLLTALANYGLLTDSSS